MIDITVTIEDLDEDIDAPRQLMFESLAKEYSEEQVEERISDLLNELLNRSDNDYIDNQLKSILTALYDNDGLIEQPIEQLVQRQPAEAD